MVDTARDDRTQDPSMVERVARAMWEPSHVGQQWPEDADGPEIWREDARNAIAAMREPTPAMVRVGGQYGDSELHIAVLWEEMIDEALKE